MPTVRLSFSPAPAHVRTARLVAVAMAQRAGVADELLEEVRLATGEACSRAVSLHRSVATDHLVEVVMTDDTRFTVSVTDHVATGPVSSPYGADQATHLSESYERVTVNPETLAEEAVVVRMGLALLAGLVDDLEVVATPGGVGTEVRMSWPRDRQKSDKRL